MSNLLTRKIYRRRLTTLVPTFVALSFAGSVTLGEERTQLPVEAENYMTYHLGRWESNTTYFDADGNVTRTAVEGYGEETLIPGQVNLHFSYNSDGSTNTAFRFYSPEEDKLYMIDVTAKGQWWILSGDRGTEVQYSHTKELPDGRSVTLKVTHLNIKPESFEAIADVSFDGGKTWRKMSHQDYRKIGDDTER